MGRTATRGTRGQGRGRISCHLDTNVEVTAGWTPLHAAAEAGHHGVVRLLLEAGAEVGLVTRDTGYSSLHLAASGVASLAL